MNQLWKGLEPRQRERLRWTVPGIAATAVLAVMIVGTRGAEPEGPVFNTARLLAQARAESPFQLRYPSVVPAGLTLNNVMWGGADPREYPGSTDFYVDYWFVDGGGVRLHVWQTNLKDLGIWDPTRNADGTAEMIAGAAWIYQPVSLGEGSTTFQLSRRLPDGVLVTIDYQVDGQVLRNVASALTTADR